MGEMLKELGKLFYNLALLIAGAVIIQPVIKGNFSQINLIFGSISFLGFVILGSVLITVGEKLKCKEE
ncbi:MAG: hypothetical protein DSZ31_02735 [Gammaproteobacteria bacterium]|nr:MAG: hypothetical protein DSZ31_02735 [Gammaproteobacteria bacterium]